MQINTAPAPSHFPEPVASIVRELTKLHERRGDLGPRRHELGLSALQFGNDQLMVVAKRLDAEALGEAARNGDTLTTVGTPNADKLTADRAALTLDETGLETAIDETTAELQRALRAAHDEIVDTLDRATEEATTAYATALDQLVAARQQLLEAQAVRSFVDRAVNKPASSYSAVNYVVALDGELPLGNRFGSPVRFTEAVAAMRREMQS
jgi:hypothetical protein